jgi:uncharacterized protein YqhQ
MPKQDIGGQAVIEGVMMRSKRNIVTAVRKKAKIIYKKDKIKKKPKWMQFFFIRGIVNLIEMLIIGIKTLNWSASQQVGEEEELSNFAIVITMIIAFAFAIALFMLLPYILTYLIGIKETNNPLWFNIINGIIKAGILILYVYLISLMKEIRRVFQYHGAEHKAVFCYEDNKKLTVENAKKYTTLHPRCGTAFLIIVIIIGIFLFSFIPVIVSNIYPNINNIHWLLKRAILFISRILLLPVIAGFAYEALKFGAKHQDNPIFRTLTLPGLWIQKITTKNPSKKQLEVAIAALKKVLNLENGNI